MDRRTDARSNQRHPSEERAWDHAPQVVVMKKKRKAGMKLNFFIFEVEPEIAALAS